MPKPDNPLGEPDGFEKIGLERAAQFKRLESAYALLPRDKTRHDRLRACFQPARAACLDWREVPRLDRQRPALR